MSIPVAIAMSVNTKLEADQTVNMDQVRLAPHQSGELAGVVSGQEPRCFAAA
jgi:hypothetical protein